MKLNQEYFPQHRELSVIRSEIAYHEQLLTEDLEDVSVEMITKKLLELKLEYATADHHSLSMSMMFLSRMNDNYFTIMRRLRDKQNAKVEARHELIKYENSLK